MKIITVLFLVFLYSYSIGQIYCGYKFDHTWILGDADPDTVSTDNYGGCEINYNTSPPSYSLHPKSVGSSYQNTSMSSKDGDLLFYSNGCAVYNKEDTVMEGGDSLNPGEVYDFGCPYSGYVGFQNMISIPDSYNDSIFYLFHISLSFNPNLNSPIALQSESLYYTKINILLNSGYGKVVAKNVPIISDTNLITTPLTATKHSNGLDWWLITPDRWGNSYNIILLNESGPHYFGKQFIGDSTNPIAEGGQGKFSPNGNQFAWYHPKNGLFLFDFNRNSGELSNFKHIDIPFEDFIAGGCEFSPSGRFLYVNHRSSLFQMDMNSKNIQNSITHIADYDGFADPLPTAFFFMELTPDNKILMNVVNGSQWLHIIQEPEKQGIACKFEQHGIKLPTVNNFTLPHFPNYKLGESGDPLCDSVVVSVLPLPDLYELKIFPNPASDVVTVQNWKDGNTLYVLDVIGNTIIESKDSSINVSNLSPGFYILLVRNSLSDLGMCKLVVSQN